MDRIVIVTGPPGAGKSTVARRLTQRVAAPLAMHLHTDDIYTYVHKGFVPPWMPEARHQNVTLQNAIAAQAAICAKAGYEVFVDGIIGAWFFDPWLAVARDHGLDLHYVLLLPDLATATARATARKPGAMTDAGVVQLMWGQFSASAVGPEHRIDTTDHTLTDTVDAVFEGLADGRFRVAV